MRDAQSQEKNNQEKDNQAQDNQQIVAAFMERARAAQQVFEKCSQTEIDMAVTAIAWAGYNETNAQTLAQLAYDHSGLGKTEDKFTSVGVIEVDEDRGVTTLAKPMGVIAAILPSTNPAATVINNMMITLKGGNAVILAPHPKGEAACATAVELARTELEKLNLPVDLVQYVSLKAANKEAGKARAQVLMEQADYSLVTAGPANVDMAYRSGTPSHGVGVGNAPVIIDECADLVDAIPKIIASKTFDNATSCSSENSLVIHSSRYDDTVQALQEHGAYLTTPAEKSTIAELAGLEKPEAQSSKIIMVEENGVGPDYPFSGEKLSVVLTLYKYDEFDEALGRVNSILEYMGLGHSCGIHSHNADHVEQLAESAKVSGGRRLRFEPSLVNLTVHRSNRAARR